MFLNDIKANMFPHYHAFRHQYCNSCTRFSIATISFAMINPKLKASLKYVLNLPGNHSLTELRLEIWKLKLMFLEWPPCLKTTLRHLLLKGNLVRSRICLTSGPITCSSLLKLILHRAHSSVMYFERSSWPSLHPAYKSARVLGIFMVTMQFYSVIACNFQCRCVKPPMIKKKSPRNWAPRTWWSAWKYYILWISVIMISSSRILAGVRGWKSLCFLILGSRGTSLKIWGLKHLLNSREHTNIARMS